MHAHLSHVAAGSTQTDLASHRRKIGHCFEQGVPADDETCIRMMRALPSDGQVLEYDISAEFFIELSFLDAGADDPEPYPDCDAYGEDEKSIKAEFYRRIGNQAHEVGSIRARANPNGLRHFIRDARSAARNLKQNGLCPQCPDPAEALMRIPRGKYCAECCFAVAILGEQNKQ